jgi:hypothetical protein
MEPQSRSLVQIWVKPSSEMQFLYGNNVLKSGLGRITENTPAYTGVVVYSMSDVPLGFGVTGKSTDECRTADPSSIVVFHQADVGEWSFPPDKNAQQYSDMHVTPVAFASGRAPQASTSELRTSFERQGLTVNACSCIMADKIDSLVLLDIQHGAVPAHAVNHLQHQLSHLRC